MKEDPKIGDEITDIVARCQELRLSTRWGERQFATFNRALYDHIVHSTTIHPYVKPVGVLNN